MIDFDLWVIREVSEDSGEQFLTCLWRPEGLVKVEFRDSCALEDYAILPQVVILLITVY